MAVAPNSPHGSWLRLTGMRSRADEGHRLADPTVDTPPSRAARLDSESQGWIERLSPQSPQRDTAIAALHAHLLKAAAFKFALFEAGAKIRRRAWQGREVQMEPEGWSLLAHRGATPQEGVETAELLAAL